MLSPISDYKTCNLKFKTPKFDYKQNIQGKIVEICWNRFEMRHS
jgi:hypothetical protein